MPPSTIVSTDREFAEDIMAACDVEPELRADPQSLDCTFRLPYTEATEAAVKQWQDGTLEYNARALRRAEKRMRHLLREAKANAQATDVGLQDDTPEAKYFRQLVAQGTPRGIASRRAYQFGAERAELQIRLKAVSNAQRVGRAPAEGNGTAEGEE